MIFLLALMMVLENNTRPRYELDEYIKKIINSIVEHKIRHNSVNHIATDISEIYGVSASFAKYELCEAVNNDSRVTRVGDAIYAASWDKKKQNGEIKKGD